VPAKESGLRKSQSCQDLDLGLPTPRTVKKRISVVEAIQCVILCYGSPSKLIYTDIIKLYLILRPFIDIVFLIVLILPTPLSSLKRWPLRKKWCYCGLKASFDKAAQWTAS
jgi:hypothetical protein